MRSLFVEPGWLASGTNLIQGPDWVLRGPPAMATKRLRCAEEVGSVFYCHAKPGREQHGVSVVPDS